MHAELVGRIVKFYPDEQAADIQPLVKTVLGGKAVDMPVLPKVPLNLTRFGGFAVTYKIKEGKEQGDFVKLSFADRSLESYLKDGKAARPESARMNNLSDATAEPFAVPKDKRLKGYKNDRVSLRSEDGKQEVSLTDQGKIVLRGKDGEEVLKILADWLQHYIDHTNQGAPLDQKASAQQILTRLNKLKE